MSANNVYRDGDFDFEAGPSSWQKGNTDADGGNALETSGGWFAPSTFDTIGPPARPGNNNNNNNENYSIIPSFDTTWGNYQAQLTLRPTDSLGGSNVAGNPRYAVYLQSRDYQSLGDDYYRAVQLQFHPTQNYTAGGVRLWEMHDYADTDWSGGVAPHALDAQEDIFISDADWYTRFPQGVYGTRPHAYQDFTQRGFFYWCYGMCFGDGTAGGRNLNTDPNNTVTLPSQVATYTIRQIPLKAMVPGEIAKLMMRLKLAEDQTTAGVSDGAVQIWLDTTSGTNPTPSSAILSDAPIFDYVGPTMKWVSGSNVPQARHGIGDQNRVDVVTGVRSDLYGTNGVYRGTIPAGGPIILYSRGVRRRRTKSAAIAAFGTGSAPSTPTANTVAPSITGTKTQGQTLTGADGTWTGTPAPTVTGRRWLRCDQSGLNGVAIQGATSTTYLLVTADIGSTIRYEVTETNTGGTVAAISAATTVIAAAGSSTTPSVGTVVTAFSGGASNLQATVAITQPFQGLVVAVHDTHTQSLASPPTCDGVPMTQAQPNVDNDAGPSLSLWKAVNPRVGNVSVVVTGTNTRTWGITCVPVRDCDTVQMLGAVSTSKGYDASPTVTCASTSGDLVLGFWTAEHEGASNGTPAQGSGQTQLALTEVTSVGNYTAGLALKKTAAGATTTVSLTESPRALDGYVFAAVTVMQAVNQAPPINTVLPTITGTATVGQTLSCSAGTWANTDGSTVFSYQWMQVTVGSVNVAQPIVGANSATHTVTAADVGFNLSCIVTAATTAGTLAVQSGQVTPTAIYSATVHSSFNITAENPLSDGGKWGSDPIQPGVNLLQVVNAGTGYATGTTGSCQSHLVGVSVIDSFQLVKIHTVAGAGFGTGLRSRVQNPNTAQACSYAGDYFPGVGYQIYRQVNGNTYTLLGTSTTPHVHQPDEYLAFSTAGSTLTVYYGSSNGDGTYTVTPALVVTDTTIPSAGTIGLEASDQTQRLSNYASNATIVAAVPTNSVVPAITGTATVGLTLTGSTGTWANLPTMFSRQWNRAGNPISGATGSTYVLTDDDIGLTITESVTAANIAGSLTVTSAATSAVGAVKPVLLSTPFLSGPVISGGVLTASTGAWSHNSTFGYQWQRTDAGGGNASNIVGATGSSYTLQPADLAGRVQVVVTATNTAGATTATSSPTGIVAVSSGRNVVIPRVAGGTRVVGGTKTAGGGGL